MEKEASTWFQEVYPRTKTLEWPHAAPLDVVQEPGETIFVPCGWWHCVMNLDTTVAVTQNYVASSNFGAAWRWTRKGRPKTSQRWLEALRRERPDLARVAEDIDARRDYQGYPSATSSSSSSSDSSDGGDDSDKS